MLGVMAPDFAVSGASTVTLLGVESDKLQPRERGVQERLCEREEWRGSKEHFDGGMMGPGL